MLLEVCSGCQFSPPVFWNFFTQPDTVPSINKFIHSVLSVFLCRQTLQDILLVSCTDFVPPATSCHLFYFHPPSTLLLHVSPWCLSCVWLGAHAKLCCAAPLAFPVTQLAGKSSYSCSSEKRMFGCGPGFLHCCHISIGHQLTLPALLLYHSRSGQDEVAAMLHFWAHMPGFR